MSSSLIFRTIKKAPVLQELFLLHLNPTFVEYIEYNIKLSYKNYNAIICTYLFSSLGGFTMKHIKTLNERVLKDTIEHGGCGECQTSCQSACKTSCTVGNQSCENKNN